MNVLANLLSQPALLLEPNAFNSHAILNGHLRLEARPVPAKTCCDDCQTELPARHDRILEIITPPEMSAASTAIIRVDGLMVKHVDPRDIDIFGLVDLDDVDAAIAQVANDEQIENVLFVFNTPGGCVIGVPETADRINQLAQIKNVKAFCDSICCSAGVYLATQASEFFVTKSAHTGCIGAIRPPILDISKALKAQGIEVTIIKRGKYKDIGSQLRPVTEDDKAMLDAYVGRVNSMFQAAVLRNRRMSTDAMQGQVFFGDEAVDVGLADAVLADQPEALGQFS